MRTTASMIIVLMVFSSCTAPLHMYTPPGINNPALEQKGDAEVKLAWSGGGKQAVFKGDDVVSIQGADVQGAVAITDKFAVQGLVSATKESNTPEGGTGSAAQRVNHYKRWHAEAGMGYFTPLGRQGKIYFSMFAGGGTGAYKAQIFSNGIAESGFYNNRVNRLYLQPALYGNWKQLRAGLAFKLVSQGYYGAKTSLTQQQQVNEKLDELGNGRVLFGEAALRLGFVLPWDWCSPELQYTYSNDLNGRIKNMNHSMLSIGVRLHLNRIKPGR